MAISMTETFGLCENVLQFLRANQADLRAKGLEVAGLITELEAQSADAVAKNEEQERLKASLSRKTAETVAAVDLCYTSASTKLDAVIGVLGKTTELGKRAAAMRSGIRRGPNPTPEKSSSPAG